MPPKIFFAKNPTHPTVPGKSSDQMATVKRAESDEPPPNPWRRHSISVKQAALVAAQKKINGTHNNSSSTVSDQRSLTDKGSDDPSTSSFETDPESTSLKSGGWGEVKKRLNGIRNILKSKNVEKTSQTSDAQRSIAQVSTSKNRLPDSIRRATTPPPKRQSDQTIPRAATELNLQNARAKMPRRNSAPGVLATSTPTIDLRETTNRFAQSNSAAINIDPKPYVPLQLPSFDFEEENGENWKKWGESTLAAIDQVREKYRNQNE